MTSEGESRDLRKNLPVLVAASIDYVGKDSHGQKTIKIKDSDKFWAPSKYLIIVQR